MLVYTYSLNLSRDIVSDLMPSAPTVPFGKSPTCKSRVYTRPGGRRNEAGGSAFGVGGVTCSVYRYVLLDRMAMRRTRTICCSESGRKRTR